MHVHTKRLATNHIASIAPSSLCVDPHTYHYAHVMFLQSTNDTRIISEFNSGHIAC